MARFTVAMATVLRSARTGTTITILTLARLTVITVLIGLPAGSSSEQARGITDIGAAAAGVTATATTDGAFMDTVAIMAAVDTATVVTMAVAATVDTAVVTLDTATRTVRAAFEPDLVAADSMAAAVVDSMAADTDKSGER